MKTGISLLSPQRISRSTKVFILLVLLYLLVPLLVPANHITKATYQINSAQYQSLYFIIRLSTIGVWITAFYAYRRLYRYRETVAGTPEGKKFATITKGVAWLAWGLVVPSVSVMTLNSIANSFDNFLSVAVAIGNYSYVIFSLFAFSYIGSGTHNLALHNKITLSNRHIRVAVAVLAIVSVIFCLLINDKLQPHNLISTYNAFYLPEWLIWASVVIPYLYAWFIGVFAAMELFLIARRTSGIIYRQALQLLSFGLVTMVVAIFASQYFRAIIPRNGHLTLGVSLIITYIIYAVYILGSILIITGARRLQRIEDI